LTDINWGPTGELVYDRTYSRDKPGGGKETWPETVNRVVDGNMGLVSDRFHEKDESHFLEGYIKDFALLPAGRHLWATGVGGRQFIFNCWAAGWAKFDVSRHFTFTFLRLMEGGGVGANYSYQKTRKYSFLKNIEIRAYCDEDHGDYELLNSEGVLSDGFPSRSLQGGGVNHETIYVEDSREGWAEALGEVLYAASFETDSWDKEVVHVDVSDVRPSGAPLRQFGGTASGPLPLVRMLQGVAEVINQMVDENRPMSPLDAMEIDHAIAQCVVAGGVRRSARMSILPWDDPYIEDFLKCKEDPSKHWTTNISVATDDKFYRLLNKGDDKAEKIMGAISEGMLENGEPGIWNWQLSQEDEYGVVDTTNPCGEIPLEDWEACNLGHINLDAFAPIKRGAEFDLWGACDAARYMVRFLIRATFGDITDPVSQKIMDRNRRIGIGLTGVQSALAKMGIPYSQAWMRDEFSEILLTLRRQVDLAAYEYSRQLRIPAPVKVTTVAPTGTISKLAGVSEGIHPIYSRYFIRRVRFSTLRPEEVAMVDEYRKHGYKVEDDQYSNNTVVVEFPTKDILVDQVTRLGYPEGIVESSDEITLGTMMRTQRIIQTVWADNAVSYTANINADEYSVEDLSETLKKYGPYLKGTTVMPRNDSRPQSPYEAISRDEYEEANAKQVSDSVDESCMQGGACPVR